MSQRITNPRYVKIALDVAGRIFKGEINEGTKLRGRSILASEYNVSPETIRKAMKLLEDTHVVSITKGSGITVISKNNAFTFLESFKDNVSISTLRKQLKDLFEEKNRIEKEIKNLTETIIDLYKFKRGDLIEHIELEITSNSNIIGKTIEQSSFWQNTGGTIIGIKRDNKTFISPGPYFEFSEGDKILVVGDEGIVDRINSFLYL